MSADCPPLTFALDRESAGVVVWFEGTAHAFTKAGAPNSLNYREKAVLRALLEAALKDLEPPS